MNNKIHNWPKKYWPKEILEIPQPPCRLRIRGPMPDPNLFRLCVVGPRKYSQYGETVCRKIVSGLADYPISIISGLAYGIDSIAHKVALENNIPCIAIPGSGLEDSVIYPKPHLGLAHKILENRGCLISEYDDNFTATRWGFPKRNRIMVGLSQATLLVEGREQSGTMISARMT